MKIVQIKTEVPHIVFANQHILVYLIKNNVKNANIHVMNV